MLLVLRGYELDILGEIADTEDTAVAGIPGQEDGDADTFGNIAVEGEKARRVAWRSGLSLLTVVAVVLVGAMIVASVAPPDGAVLAVS